MLKLIFLFKFLVFQGIIYCIIQGRANMKTQEKYTSAKMTEIPYNLYTPTIRFRFYGIVQIIHPFGEHIERYDHFARF